jgi:penicillin-binding protein 1A
MVRRRRRKTRKNSSLVPKNIRANVAWFFGWPWFRLPKWKWKNVARLSVLTAFWGFAFFSAMILILSWSLPDIRKAVDMDDKPTVILRDRNGKEFARLGDRQGEILTVAQMSPHLIKAVVAVEDRRFYKHWGVDPIGLARAMFTNLRSRGVVQGGSTITQQLAKNLFLSPDRTITRKVKEALLAFYLERRYTKDEILAAYLNRAYFGAGAYGVDSASRVYFNTSARFLDLEQAAMLAGLLKAPSRYSPDNDPALTFKRTRIVLTAMVDAGFLSEGAQDMEIKPLPKREYNAGGSPDMRYFADWAMSQVEGYIGPSSQDLIIDTTLDSALQNFASKSLRQNLDTAGKDLHVEQGSMVVMQPDGAVVTMIGGRDYTRSQYNRAILSKRQPGSSFKPFIYLAALENGFTPDTLVTDAPIKIRGYAPENYDGKYRGTVRLQDAVSLSLNSIAVQTLDQVGISKVKGVARRLGVTDPLQSDLSLALGTSEVHMLQMASAYASLANRGLAVEPYAIRAIHTQSGISLYERRELPPIPVLEPNIVADMNKMLQGVIFYGTGQAAAINRPAAGKTGTSSDYRDAWFIGYTADLVGAVWVGNDDNTPMKRVTGGSVPARIWRDVMSAAHQNLPVRALPVGTERRNAPAAPGAPSLFDALLKNILGPPDIEWDKSH